MSEKYWTNHCDKHNLDQGQPPLCCIICKDRIRPKNPRLDARICIHSRYIEKEMGKPIPENYVRIKRNNPLNNKKMKKLKNFAIICGWGFGTIGGIGFALYGGSWPCAIGCALNAALAFPTVKNAYNEMTE